MDLIYTDKNRVDIGVLSAYAFDLSFGASENDFEIILNANNDVLVDGAFIYIEGTEYGGIVDKKKASTNGETITYGGRTWHGVLNSKVIQPPAGSDYIGTTDDANDCIKYVINMLGLAGLFVAAENKSGINIPYYTFKRYCKGYDGIRDMLSSVNAKLKIEWKDHCVFLSAVPIEDYTESPIDGDIATLTVEACKNKVNHLICLGKGELAEREVIHLYADNSGKIVEYQTVSGLDEITDVYDNTSSEDLRADGIERFKELRNIDKAEISIPEDNQQIYDIGDIVGATEYKSGVNVTVAVTQKIVKINNGVISTEYKTGS